MIAIFVRTTHHSMNPIVVFLKEVTRCDYRTSYNGGIESFTYNDVSYAQGKETYQRMLSSKYNDFKSAVLDVALKGDETFLQGILSDYKKAQSDTYYDIPDSDCIRVMEYDARNGDIPSLDKSIKEAYFLNEMVSIQKWYLQEAVVFLEGFIKEPTNNKKNSQVEESPVVVQDDKFEKRLSDYGDYLSVKDLIDIFGCTSRTITNWEKDGTITNVAEKSDETTSVGHRKRGKEKRYSKKAIIHSLALQEKYNASH